MTRTHWLCTGIPPHTPACEARGVYSQAATGDSGAAAKHTRTTGHATIAGLNEASLDRMYSDHPDATPWCQDNKHERCSGDCPCTCHRRDE